MTDEKKPIIRESREIEYEDGRRETIVIKRLSNTDLLTWVDTGFNKPFLVFRSIERADPSTKFGGGPSSNLGASLSGSAGQAWFDTLTQDSAFAVVEKAMELNHSPTLQKKILGVALANLQSWLSAMPSSSSGKEATGSTS